MSFHKHVINIVVENQFGVLAQVVAMFASRGYNISSLIVGETDDPSISLMTITVEGNEEIVEQVIKQLNKQINVIKVINLTKQEYVSRELALVKISTNKQNRHNIVTVVEAMGGNIIEITKSFVFAEFTGEEDKVENAIQLIKSYGIKEMIRTGKVALLK